MTKIESLTKLLEPQAQVIREAAARRHAGLPGINYIEACLDVKKHVEAHGFDVSFSSDRSRPPITTRDYTDAPFIITERRGGNV